VKPPVPTTTPAGAERTASSVVTGPFVAVVVVVPVSPDSVVPCTAVGLAVADSLPDGLLEAVDPAEPGESSAHAGPPLHPGTMAAPTLKAAANPPIRPSYAWRGMRYVYRLTSIGSPGIRRSPQLSDVDVNTADSAIFVALVVEPWRTSEEARRVQCA
jgi:hypothetical protein